MAVPQNDAMEVDESEAESRRKAQRRLAYFGPLILPPAEDLPGPETPRHERLRPRIAHLKQHQSLVRAAYLSSANHSPPDTTPTAHGSTYSDTELLRRALTKPRRGRDNPYVYAPPFETNNIQYSEQRQPPPAYNGEVVPAPPGIKNALEAMKEVEEYDRKGRETVHFYEKALQREIAKRVAVQSPVEAAVEGARRHSMPGGALSGTSGVPDSVLGKRSRAEESEKETQDMSRPPLTRALTGSNVDRSRDPRLASVYGRR